MTPAEAARTLDSVRSKSSGTVHLRLVGSVDNPDADGPGARLQAARHAAGLSVVQVAEALRLKPPLIAAIEEMAFDRLPGLGYALGFVRAYAELMDIADVEALVDSCRAAWEPEQLRKEAGLKGFSRRAAAPAGAVLALAALGWLVLWAGAHMVSPPREEAVAPPDEAIRAWARADVAAPARAAAQIEPEVTLNALRPVRVTLRGADGALVIDRTLRTGESISTDGLGRWFLSTQDAGALEVRGHGQTVRVGADGAVADWWRVPDLAAAAAAARAAAAEAEAAAEGPAAPVN